MNSQRTAALLNTHLNRDEVDTLGPTSDRWSDAATVYELAGVATHDCCGLPEDMECGCDPAEVAAFSAAAAQVFADPILCRPANQWGA